MDFRRWSSEYSLARNDFTAILDASCCILSTYPMCCGVSSDEKFRVWKIILIGSCMDIYVSSQTCQWQIVQSTVLWMRGSISFGCVRSLHIKVAVEANSNAPRDAPTPAPTVTVDVWELSASVSLEAQKEVAVIVASEVPLTVLVIVESMRVPKLVEVVAVSFEQQLLVLPSFINKLP